MGNQKHKDSNIQTLASPYLTHLVAQLPHQQVKSSGIRQIKEIGRVHWGTLPINELIARSQGTVVLSLLSLII